jgi:glycosyltransferase involved in cell wall biosynthesis
MEIILVDDGSTDDTLEIIKSLANENAGIKYYSRPHCGLCAARNFGLDNAGGDFIGFFDGDDLWPPNYIETMVKSLQANPDFGAAYSRAMLFKNGEICGQYPQRIKPTSGYITADLFRGKPFILPSSVIFRKDIWNEFHWDEAVSKCAEDLDAFLRLSMKTKFIYVPDTYMMRRENNNSVSALAAKDLFNDGPRVLERFYFQLGGSSYVPKGLAFRSISHCYRRFALRNYRQGNRVASIALLRRALSYYPFDLRLYFNLLMAVLLNPRHDKFPDWRLPAPLSKELSKGLK